MPRKPDTRHQHVGSRHRAATRYALLCHRVSDTNNSRNKCYKGVEVRVSREQFIAWFMARDFPGCSVDRVDVVGHYELSNMQLISLAENIAKDKVVAKDGVCKCYACGAVKALSEFAKDKRRATGRSTICKQCDAAREKTESKEARERRLAAMSAYYKKRKTMNQEAQK